MDERLKSVIKNQLKRQLLKMGAKLGKAILVKTAPVWIPILVVLLLVWLIYGAIFVIPKQSIFDPNLNQEDRLDSFFLNSKEVSVDVFAAYAKLAESWDGGLTEEQLSQVGPYSLNWEFLAQTDRIFSDPAFLITYRSVKEKELKLDPDGTFQSIRPQFEWMQETIVTVRETCSCHEETEIDEEGNEITKTVCNKSSYKTEKPQILLGRSNTMQNVYLYSYRTDMYTTSESSSCGSLTTTITQKKLESIESSTEDWEPLRTLLIQNGVTRAKDQDFLLEYLVGYLTDRDGGDGASYPFPLPQSGEFLWPTEGIISSTFGKRIDPITRENRLHAGLDIAAPKGTPIYAAHGGKVVYAAAMGTAGNAVIISHDDGLETRYYHMNKINTMAGELVKQGDKIGEVGTTGNSTGYHLHLEVRVNGQPTDPLTYFITGGVTKP